MDIEHLQYLFFFGVIDKFNLFDVLSYRNSNKAMEGSGTDAAWQSCLGNRAVKGKAGDVKGLDAEAESSLGEKFHNKRQIVAI